MKNYNFLIFLTVLFMASIAIAQLPCPCDNLELSNGTTGGDILNALCPGGRVGPDTSVDLRDSSVTVFTEVVGAGKTYQVDSPPLDGICYISQEGQNQESLKLKPEEALICRAHVIETCDLLSRPIPTLSEWGVIAMAGILGIAGYIIISRRKVNA